MVSVLMLNNSPLNYQCPMKFLCFQGLTVTRMVGILGFLVSFSNKSSNYIRKTYSPLELQKRLTVCLTLEKSRILRRFPQRKQFTGDGEVTRAPPSQGRVWDMMQRVTCATPGPPIAHTSRGKGSIRGKAARRAGGRDRGFKLLPDAGRTPRC